MRTGSTFFLVINLLFTLFLIFVGLFIVMIPWAPDFRERLIEALRGNSYALLLFGSGILCIGLLLLIGFYMMYRHRYYRIIMGNHEAEIDQEVFQKYLSAYWKKVFFDDGVESEVVLGKNGIEVIAHCPHVPLNQQRDLLERIEDDLKSLFSEIFDYHKEFYLTISFQREKL